MAITKVYSCTIYGRDCSLTILNSADNESICVSELRGQHTGVGSTAQLSNSFLASLHPRHSVPDLQTAIFRPADQQPAVLAPDQVSHRALLVAAEFLDETALGEVPDSDQSVVPGTGGQLPIRRGGH